MQASLQVFELFREFCPQCERASVDEAYFDVTSMVRSDLSPHPLVMLSLAHAANRALSTASLMAGRS